MARFSKGQIPHNKKDIDHGHHLMYGRGCRCAPCMKANTEYYAKLAGRMPIELQKLQPCKICNERERYRGRYCRECYNQESRQRMNAKLRRLSFIEREAMLKQQVFVCAICFQSETQRTKYGQVKELAEDHDHETDKVRGLLCHACNTGLGLFADSPVRLEQAALYLRRRGK